MRKRLTFTFVFCACLTSCAARTVPQPQNSSAPPTTNQQAASVPSATKPAVQVPASAGGLDLKLPLESDSLRFAVIGDSGTGESAQFEVARQMENYRKVVGYDFVIMLGDNIYGGHSPQDFARKFEQPYKPLLDAGVKFYASLGNHDTPDERLYKPFNMGGERYYTFKKKDVMFFVLDSTYMDPAQMDWLEKQLRTSGEAWKICYFHHPLYSDGKFHGPDLDLRSRLVPLFLKYGVNVVFSGHEHVYERVKPKNGIYYFVIGSSGQLRFHNLRASQDTQTGFDTDQEFVLVEISKDKLYFQTVSRTGKIVDSDVLQRQAPPGKASALFPHNDGQSSDRGFPRRVLRDLPATQ
jgi:predicted phosphodiesterase